MPEYDFVVKTVAAGKAGLDALPYFLDEFIAHDIPLLKPHALDHSSSRSTMDAFDSAMKIDGGAKRFVERGYNWDWNSVGEVIAGAPQLEAGIELRHPIFLELDGWQRNRDFYDRPAALAEWPIQNASRLWEEYYNEWMEYYNQGHEAAKRLIIMIPYCPEGPTSGTIGMWLAATLREQADRAISTGQLASDLRVSIIGIEMCPYMPAEMIKQNEEFRHNAFRGYVARNELFYGKIGNTESIQEQPARRPFDICVAVDAHGDGKLFPNQRANVEMELDKAAARVALSLVLGYLGADFGESFETLSRHWRWEAHLFDIRSEDRMVTVLPYLVQFPDVSDDVAENTRVAERFWNSGSELARTWREVAGVREAFTGELLSDSMRTWKVEAPQINALVEAANQWSLKLKEYDRLRASFDRNPIQKFFALIVGQGGPSREEMESKRTELRQAVEGASSAYHEVMDAIGEENESTNIWRSKPFGFTIQLTKEMVRDYLQKPRALGQLLGTARVSGLREVIEGRIHESLSRYVGSRTNGKFRRIMVIPVGNPENVNILPSRGFLALHAERDETRVQIRPPRREDNQARDNYNLDFTILLLAAEAAFEDVGSYQELVNLHESVVENLETWTHEYSRYYAGDVPKQVIAWFRKQRGSRDQDGSLRA